MSPPEDDPPPNDLGSLISANTREANAYWFWRERSVGEPGTAVNILVQAGMDVVGLVSRHPHDPPDCEATLDGLFSGVEVTELVDQTTLEHSIRAIRDRKAGKEPRRPDSRASECGPRAGRRRASTSTGDSPARPATGRCGRQLRHRRARRSHHPSTRRMGAMRMRV
jgi:hypothetical protein